MRDILHYCTRSYIDVAIRAVLHYPQRRCKLLPKDFGMLNPNLSLNLRENVIPILRKAVFRLSQTDSVLLIFISENWSKRTPNGHNSNL